MSTPLEQLEREALDALEAVRDAVALEAYRVAYLGTKGRVKAVMKLIGSVPPSERGAFGKAANDLQQRVQQAFDARKAALGSSSTVPAGPMIDITEPAAPPRLGRRHPITQTLDELLDLFGRMGFDIATGPEVEDERHNFIALNIPAHHPARDPLDNFYLDTPPQAGPALLRSQTSTVQIRVMETTPPPVRIVSVGRVYRPDEHDATHYSMFHQIEGLYVDKGVTLVDLKSTLLNFAQAYWGPDADVKLVPSYFPFTEPSAEVYVKMVLRDKSQWVEVGGCGMVDPAVFEHVGYDPQVWTGFAFGLGVERLLMRKHSIPDIRWLFENDVRFLRQF